MHGICRTEKETESPHKQTNISLNILKGFIKIQLAYSKLQVLKGYTMVSSDICIYQWKKKKSHPPLSLISNLFSVLTDWFAFSRIVCKQNTVNTLLCLAAFTQHNYFEICPHKYINSCLFFFFFQSSISWYGHIIIFFFFFFTHSSVGKHLNFQNGCYWFISIYLFVNASCTGLNLQFNVK